MTPDGQDIADVKASLRCVFCSYDFHLCSSSTLYLSKQLAAKTKPSKLAEERGPHTPHSSHAPAIVIKTEPVDADEGIRKSLHSPIVITSSEEEDITPKARPSKGRNFPSSLTKQDFIRASKSISPVKSMPRPTPRPTPLGKGKETAAKTEEPLVDLPGSNQPLSESTVYLEDM